MADSTGTAASRCPRLTEKKARMAPLDLPTAVGDCCPVHSHAPSLVQSWLISHEE